MNIKEIEKLIMESYILSTKRKLELISAIKRNQISDNELNNIINILQSEKEEIDQETEKILNKAKYFQKSFRKKNKAEITSKVQRAKIEIDETIEKEKDGNPDDILNLIQ